MTIIVMFIEIQTGNIVPIISLSSNKYATHLCLALCLDYKHLFSRLRMKNIHKNYVQTMKKKCIGQIRRKTAKKFGYNFKRHQMDLTARNKLSNFYEDRWLSR